MCLSFLSFNVSAFVRKLTMGIFAAAFAARESAHLRPRITKRPNPRSATLPIHNVQHREKRRTVRHCCRQVIASETLTSTPNPLPARSRLLSFACRGRPAIARYGDGGADRDRTGDPLLAKQVLSQLSYSPRIQAIGARRQYTIPGLLKWWAREDLNFRPHAYQARALTN